MNAIRDIRALFSIFRERAGEDPPPPPPTSSYALVIMINLPITKSLLPLLKILSFDTISPIYTTGFFLYLQQTS